MILHLVSFLVLLQNPLHSQTRTINLQKPLIVEKIKLQKIDVKDLAHLAFILQIDQFTRFKR
jgi:hypothetical protein